MKCKNHAVAKVRQIWDREAFKYFQYEEMDKYKREYQLQKKLKYFDIKLKMKIISYFVDLKLNKYLSTKWNNMKRLERNQNQDLKDFPSNNYLNLVFDFEKLSTAFEKKIEIKIIRFSLRNHKQINFKVQSYFELKRKKKQTLRSKMKMLKRSNAYDDIGSPIRRNTIVRKVEKMTSLQKMINNLNKDKFMIEVHSEEIKSLILHCIEFFCEEKIKKNITKVLENKSLQILNK